MKIVPRNKAFSAFSLIELSIVIIVIGILISGVIQASNIIYSVKLNSARTLSQSSPVAGIKNLILWMDITKEGSSTNANSNTNVEEGDYIDTWRDVNPQIKSNITFTAPASTNRPIYRETGINGLPSLEFDGIQNIVDGDYLETPATIETRQPNDHTIFAVFAPIDGNDNSSQGIFVKLGASNPAYGVVFNGNVSSVGAVVTSPDLTVFSNTNSITDLKPTIVTATHDSDNVTDGLNLYINGGNLTTEDASASIQSTSDALRIGRQKNTATRACKCYISEIIMFNRVLKSEERESIEDYLSQKWSISLAN